MEVQPQPHQELKPQLRCGMLAVAPLLFNRATLIFISTQKPHHHRCSNQKPHHHRAPSASSHHHEAEAGSCSMSALKSKSSILAQGPTLFQSLRTRSLLPRVHHRPPNQ